MLHSAWSKGVDITDDEVLVELASSLNLDGAALLAEAQSPAIKEALAAATTRALEIGVFGVPTFAYQRELFWGADRTGYVVTAVRTGSSGIDEAELETALARPAAARRR